MSRKPIRYARVDAGAEPALYCPTLPELGEYIMSLDRRFNPNTLRLFAAGSDYGARMLNAGENGQDKTSGVLMVVGHPKALSTITGSDISIGDDISQALAEDYGYKVLLDPEKTLALIDDLGEKKTDSAVLFEPGGNLVRVGIYLNRPDIKRINGELDLAMAIKGNGHGGTGTRHLSALYATKRCPYIRAVMTSESGHTTMAAKRGKILRELVFDPSVNLCGQQLFKHRDLMDHWED